MNYEEAVSKIIECINVLDEKVRYVDAKIDDCATVLNNKINALDNKLREHISSTAFGNPFVTPNKTEQFRQKSQPDDEQLLLAIDMGMKKLRIGDMTRNYVKSIILSAVRFRNSVESSRTQRAPLNGGAFANCPPPGDFDGDCLGIIAPNPDEKFVLNNWESVKNFSNALGSIARSTVNTKDGVSVGVSNHTPDFSTTPVNFGAPQHRGYSQPTVKDIDKECADLMSALTGIKSDEEIAKRADEAVQQLNDTPEVTFGSATDDKIIVSDTSNATVVDSVTIPERTTDGNNNTENS